MRFVYFGDVRIHVNEYVDEMKDRISCPDEHPMIVRRGTLRTPHFAHKSGCECTCTGDMTDWHVDWQDRAKREVQEIRFNLDDTSSALTSNSRCHIADLCVGHEHLPSSPDHKGYVIEFQHSSMNEVTMRERERFYTSQGYHLVWVFDTSKWSYNIVRRSQETITIRQKTGPTFPLLGTYKNSVTKIFDFGKRELLIVTDQKGASITGRIITMDMFDATFLGKMVASDTLDMRPFHHPL